MTHTEIIRGLLQLGFNTGWVLTGEDYENIIWELKEAKPTEAALKAASKKYVDTQSAAAKTAEDKLAKLGLTSDDIRAILGM